MNQRKHILIIWGIILLYSLSCANSEKSSPQIKETVSYQVQEFDYSPMSIPDFFKALIDNHEKDYVRFSTKEYHRFCEELSIDSTNEKNSKNYYTIKILHELFTSKSASDCSVGEIWTIPYQWHWIEPNPRHEIYLNKNKQLLAKIKPPKEFSKYNSYADIDRTPYLFLSDLFAEKPKYSSNECGDFSTFGWCSEREMAFISLISLLNFKGKVKAANGHSWSELLMSMTSNDGKVNKYILQVDNTFDVIDWNLIANSEIDEWQKDLGSSKTEKWYNKKALSPKEHQRIKKHIVSSVVMRKLEKEFVTYLNSKI